MSDTYLKPFSFLRASVAQSAERQSHNLKVESSNLPWSKLFLGSFENNFFLSLSKLILLKEVKGVLRI